MALILSLLSQLPQILQALVAVLGALMSVLLAVLAVCKMIPGDSPDNIVQGLIDGLASLLKKLGQ